MPLGFVALGVHDQVAIGLHAQAVDVRAGRVRRPDGLPAVDDKVAVILPRDFCQVSVTCFGFLMAFNFDLLDVNKNICTSRALKTWKTCLLLLCFKEF